MEKEEYRKRFCFGMSDESFFEKGTLSDLAVENLEMYVDGPYIFCLLEVGPEENVSDIKFLLKNRNNHHREAMIVLNRLILGETKPLQRIFKKQPLHDNLVKKIDNFKRTVMTLEIKNDKALRKEYIDIHRPENVCPQVLKNMDIMGILDMELYLMGYQAFLIMDTRPDFDMEKDGTRWANLPKEQEWQEYVAKFQKVNPESNASEKWKLMERIIHI